VAKPLTGTTLTHFTALQKVLGDAAFDEFFTAIQKNDVKFLVGNGATLNETREGKVAWAFTDTDDYHVAHTKGFKVACVFPDQGGGGIGTMLIPNSVGILKGCPNPRTAKTPRRQDPRGRPKRCWPPRTARRSRCAKGVPGPKDPAIKTARRSSA
jgi:iron(III) transport system substrate-binding protein